MTKFTKNLLFCLLLMLDFECSHTLVKPKWAKEHAPERFQARFETTKGSFDIEAIRAWSPMAVDRLYSLIKHEFFNNIAIYRVVPNFVAQFGTSEKPIMNAWKPYKYADEPVLQSNKRGTISFARSGKETRDTQIFINLKDNTRLDSTNYNGVKGFPVIANVTQAMNHVDSLYSGYGNKPMAKFDSLKFANVKERYKEFPQLDYIQKAYLIR